MAGLCTVNPFLECVWLCQCLILSWERGVYYAHCSPRIDVWNLTEKEGCVLVPIAAPCVDFWNFAERAREGCFTSAHCSPLLGDSFIFIWFPLINKTSQYVSFTKQFREKLSCKQSPFQSPKLHWEIEIYISLVASGNTVWWNTSLQALFLFSHFTHSASLIPA